MEIKYDTRSKKVKCEEKANFFLAQATDENLEALLKKYQELEEALQNRELNKPEGFFSNFFVNSEKTQIDKAKKMCEQLLQEAREMNKKIFGFDFIKAVIFDLYEKNGKLKTDFIVVFNQVYIKETMVDFLFSFSGDVDREEEHPGNKVDLYKKSTKLCKKCLSNITNIFNSNGLDLKDISTNLITPIVHHLHLEKTLFLDYANVDFLDGQYSNENKDERVKLEQALRKKFGINDDNKVEKANDKISELEQKKALENDKISELEQKKQLLTDKIKDLQSKIESKKNIIKKQVEQTKKFEQKKHDLEKTQTKLQKEQKTLEKENETNEAITDQLSIENVNLNETKAALVDEKAALTNELNTMELNHHKFTKYQLREIKAAEKQLLGNKDIEPIKEGKQEKSVPVLSDEDVELQKLQEEWRKKFLNDKDALSIKKEKKQEEENNNNNNIVKEASVKIAIKEGKQERDNC